MEAAAAAAGRSAASKGVPRSATTLLVKNLPYSADQGELEELFGRSGTVVRLVLPPTKVVALVEFGEAQDARWVGRRQGWWWLGYSGTAFVQPVHLCVCVPWHPPATPEPGHYRCAVHVGSIQSSLL